MNEAEPNATNNESNKLAEQKPELLWMGGREEVASRPRYAIPIYRNLSRRAETTVLLWVIMEDRNPEHLSSQTWLCTDRKQDFLWHPPSGNPAPRCQLVH
jgi:hypothetical protein